jgi:hypothetical protein
MLLSAKEELGFAIALVTFQCGTNLGSWAFGAISEADPSGRMSVAYLLSLKAGFAVGPLAASWLIFDGNFATMTGTAVVASIVVCALIVAQIRVADSLIVRTA